MSGRAAATLFCLAAGAAHGQDASPTAEVPDGGSPVEAPQDKQVLLSLQTRLETLEAEVKELRKAKKTRLIPDVAHLSVGDSVKIRLSSYVDLGFFKAMGDGVAYVRDDGHRLRPDLASYPWVFLGDPWANPINSQGDSADLGLDRTNIDRYDPIRSGGKASFIVNTVNLSLLATVGSQLFAEASMNFEPRQGNLGSSGDSLDIDLAYLEWKPSTKYDIHLFVGKFESTFGIEYRNRKAPDRFGVTPSLIARYTTGTPTGLKIRGSFLDGMFTYNFAVTNGGMTSEKLGHFHNEIDRNDFKTLSGRFSFFRRFRLGSLEVGASGLLGAQDLQASDLLYGWQVGADLKLVVSDFTLKAEYLHVIQPGGGVEQAPSLNVDGWYAELSYQFVTWMGLMARVDMRRGTLFSPPNLYVSDVLRVTGALRFDILFNLIAKVEYLRLQELSGPEIDDDVFTASLVLRY